MAIASSDSIRIGRVQMLQRVDIRAISLDEDEPRRIAHHAESHSFAVLCLRRDIDRRTGEQSSSSTVKIVDEHTFEGQHRLALAGALSDDIVNSRHVV